MPHRLDRSKSLQELDGQDWGEPPFPSHVVMTCYRLRRVPIQDLTAEDLRIMIGQKIGLEYLVPVALELLEREPFVAGDFYPGDLLGNVLDVPESFWVRQSAMHRWLSEVVGLARERLAGASLEEQEDIPDFVRERLMAR